MTDPHAYFLMAYALGVLAVGLGAAWVARHAR